MRDRGGIAVAVLIVTTVVAFVLALVLTAAAPVEREMGIVQKIFYIHLPASIGAFAAFAVNVVGCVAYLWRRRAAWDRLAGVAGEVGVVYATLSLVTGFLWARPIWWGSWADAWRVPEPRLITMLVLWLLYAGYLVLRDSFEDPERRARYSAVWGILAFADVPVVYLSVKWWGGQHPVVIEPGEMRLDPRMGRAVLAGLVAHGLLLALLLVVRYRQVRIQARVAELVEETGS
jgi:heme exporter protein C